MCSEPTIWACESLKCKHTPQIDIFPSGQPKISTVHCFLNFDILWVMIDLLYVEWIFLTSLNLFCTTLNRTTALFWQRQNFGFPRPDVTKEVINTLLTPQNMCRQKALLQCLTYRPSFTGSRVIAKIVPTCRFVWLLRSLKSFEQIIWRTIKLSLHGILFFIHFGQILVIFKKNSHADVLAFLSVFLGLMACKVY